MSKSGIINNSPTTARAKTASVDDLFEAMARLAGRQEQAADDPKQRDAWKQFGVDVRKLRGK